MLDEANAEYSRGGLSRAAKKVWFFRRGEHNNQGKYLIQIPKNNPNSKPQIPKNYLL